MSEEIENVLWRGVRRCPRPARSILRHQLRKRRTTVLIAECDDGHWATTDIRLGATTQVQKLGLGLAKSVRRLYEVDVSDSTSTFRTVFETDQEGAIVEGVTTVRWRVTDPVALIKQPKADHVDAIRIEMEDILRPLVRRTTLDEVENLADRVNEKLKAMRPLPAGTISWGEVDARFRLTGEGALHRYSLEEIKRARIVDRERRDMDRERINFYADVIDSGKVSLLAMMLSNDRDAVRDVLQQIHTFDIPVGRSVLDANDPFRNAVGRMMSEADDFDLHEMRLAWLSGLTSRSRESELNRLRDSLDETLGADTSSLNNGHKP
ncbi:hypothetical protein H4696_006598 [Amycolatopsis lexingtonensis]|uniref:Uncharacterized protein n=1 Tax=Amycolatopsis lexingtonensis TaxID=218822 RepID=A0ABR9I8I0_9PSEU|nr:hypothetical protein [Amycolatopsis lexingtonensis]MBE1499498.1 hypothetical protein [Amycolatopsis lexingtonensis]